MAEGGKQGVRPRGVVGTVAEMLLTMLRSVIAVALVAGLAATIFSWWTPLDFLPQSARENLSIAQATSAARLDATPLPVDNWERRVGIVAGHWGYDPGAVCEDGSGLTEADVNHAVAERVVRELRARQYEVDLLEEFDERLADYRAAALLSIHADSCEYINELATGFKVTSAVSRGEAPEDEHLVHCLITHYAQVTGLRLHPSITEDMTHYHTFSEISPLTPAAIIEIGFLHLDRALLTQEPDRIAGGIVEALLCYLEPPATPTPPPDETPASP